MLRFTQPAENPLPSIAILAAMHPSDEMSVAVIADGFGTTLCVHPKSDDSKVPSNAVYITTGDDAFLAAAVVGVVHRHNADVAAARSAQQAAEAKAKARDQAAIAAFFEQARIDFHFGIDFGRDAGFGGG